MERLKMIKTGLMGMVLIFWMGACEKIDTDASDNLPNLRTITAVEQQVISSANNFSMDLLSAINQLHTGDNVFISPFSVSAALSMTLNGAKGETKDAMKQTLHLSHMSDEEVNAAYKGLVEFLLQLDKKVDLQVANSNWYTQDLNIHAEFAAILREYYDAEVKSANFGDPATVGRINGWIEDKTRGKIKDMLDAIPPDAVMYLINAIYFKADWKYTFDEKATSKKPFFTPSGEKQVDMMHSKGVKMNVYNHNDFILADLPYGNGQFSMTILMPHAGRDINQTINTLSLEGFAGYINQTDTTTAEVYLPKFKLEFKEELKDVLSDMGMGIAFSAAADFSGLFKELLPLAISRVLHQSFIEVNEKGSEAAAATIVEIVRTSIGGEPTPKVINFNRPFTFFIREKHSNTILFSGKILDPTM
ncbi:MAG: serpin family protein [Cyclobacteriaceae bacterium]|nr:serpin family protein [Cyclobacteriaceae bacterium]